MLEKRLLSNAPWRACIHYLTKQLKYNYGNNDIFDIYLKLALIWLLKFVRPLNLHASERSRKSYKRTLESFDVTC